MTAAASPKQGRKIAIVGASGNVGAPTVAALLAEGIHTVTVITRPDSGATFPAGVARVERGSYSDPEFLAGALAGQDALVLLLGFTAMEAQEPLIRAAARAGVRVVLPTEFGSDTEPTPLLEQIPLLQAKKQPRDLIESLGMTWIAVVTNPWLEYNLENGSWGFDVKKRTARLIDGGDAKFITTKMGTVGRATAGLLSLPDAELARFRNAPFYVQSFRITQREFLASLQRATSTAEADWQVEVLDGAQECRDADAQGGVGGMMRKFFALHLRDGFGADYGAKVGGNMELVGAVEAETLDEAVRTAVRRVEGH
ncbi:hypothetical protein RB595_004354 [Gaeumannomyces hyphopodioides]